MEFALPKGFAEIPQPIAEGDFVQVIAAPEIRNVVAEIKTVYVRVDDPGAVGEGFATFAQLENGDVYLTTELQRDIEREIEHVRGLAPQVEAGDWMVRPAPDGERTYRVMWQENVQRQATMTEFEVCQLLGTHWSLLRDATTAGGDVQLTDLEPESLYDRLVEVDAEFDVERSDFQVVPVNRPVVERKPKKS